MAEEDISVGDFVSRLFAIKHKEITQDELLRYGHFRGWLEDSDERFPQAPLNRQTAARIIHQFMKIECGLSDLSDITPALVLKDLYTCRVCTNHIAQVYTRKIMKGEPDLTSGSDSPSIFFNHLALVSESEALKILEELFKLIS